MVEEDGMPLLDAEVKIFGAHHGQVGAFILGLWGLAGPIVEAVHWYRTLPIAFQLIFNHLHPFMWHPP